MVLSLDELPSDRLITAYLATGKIIYLLTVLTVVFTMYTMHTASNSSMKKYHHLLLNEILWSFASDTALFLMGLVILFPLPCVALIGGASYFPLNYDLVFMTAIYLTYCGRSTALNFQYFYRVALVVIPNTPIRGDYIIAAFLANFGVEAGGVWLIYRQIPDQHLTKDLIVGADSSITAIFERYPHITCFSPMTDVGSKLLPSLFIFIGIPFFGAFMTAFIYYRIVTSRWSAKTIQLQKMFLVSMIAQGVTIIVCLAGPMYFLVIAPALEVRNIPKISIFLSLLVMSHTIFDCMMVLWFVKPYRRRWKEMMGCGKKIQTISSTSTSQGSLRQAKNAVLR